MAKRKSKNKKRKKGEPYGAWANVAGLAIVCLAVLVLLSLASYHPHDTTNGKTPPNDPLQNACGAWGAWTASLLYEGFGLSAFALGLVLLCWGAGLSVGRVPSYIGLRIAGSGFLVCALASIDGLVHFSALGLPDKAWLLNANEGGQVGAYFADQMGGLLGLTGGLIVLIGALILSAVLAADEWVFKACTLTVAGVRWLVAWAWETICWTWDIWAEWREERAVRKTEALEEVEEYEEEYDEEPEDEYYEEEYEDEEEYEEEEPVKPKPKKAPKKAKIRIRKEAPKLAAQLKQQIFKPMAPGFDPASYKLPPIDLLEDPPPFDAGDLEEQIAHNIQVLERTLDEFGIDARVAETDRGPVITLYALELAAGVKVQKVMALSNDLSRALKSTGLRIVAPIPNTPYVGVEIPNVFKEQVRLKEIIGSTDLNTTKKLLPIVLGKDASGKPIVEDLSTMPHLLIAGTTGSGKSVCLNSVIATLLLTRYPSDVKMLLVDPKTVELASYRDIPHLLHPVITDMKKAPQVLEWAVKKMEDRYQYLAVTHTRNIAQFNKLGKAKIEQFMEKAGAVPGDVPYHLPYIVIVIDELADLMMTSRKEVETHITRLAQKSRAIGIHIILATQRPSTDVITGLIKSNISARISFRVFSKVDSRVILDRNGAESLLGQGDMLYLVPGTSDIVRAQGSFVSDAEIHTITDFVKEQAKPEYSQELQQWGAAGIADAEKDELYDRAAELVIDSQRGSVSMLQRQLAIGYTRASRLMDQLSMGGIVGDFKGSKAREVLVKPDEYERMKLAQNETD